MGGDRPQVYGPKPGQKLKISKAYLFGLTETPFKLVGTPHDEPCRHTRKKSGVARFAEMVCQCPGQAPASCYVDMKNRSQRLAPGLSGQLPTVGKAA